MKLLNDFIQASRCQLENSENKKGQIMEKQTVVKPAAAVEFIPVNTTFGEPSAKKSRVEDAPNWMKSAGLWTKNHETEQSYSHADKVFPLVGSTKHPLDYKNRAGGAFVPFSRERQEISSCSDHEEQVSDSHSSSFNKCVILNNSSHTSNKGVERIPPNTNIDDGKIQRKARRCWSPELHQNFVNALQQLGGAHATPKHIRELMKVDGLTNDEVKSHLQKYRLHIRRPTTNWPRSSDQSHGGELLLVRGIWVPPDYAGASTQLHTHTYYCQPSTCTGLQHS